MPGRFIRKFIFEPGLISALTLIGILILSGLLYYRSVRIQRFLEPALAISQPRIEFSNSFYNLYEKEFGPERTEGVLFTSNSIFVHGLNLLAGKPSQEDVSEPMMYQKLARIFDAILKDPDLSPDVEMILIGTKVYPTSNHDLNERSRVEAQQRAEFILHALFAVAPELEKKFGTYFASTALQTDIPEEVGWVEFRIIPSGRLHISIIQTLQHHAE